MKTFQVVEPPIIKSFVVVKDHSEYKYYFACVDGQIYISNEDIGDFNGLDEEEIKECALSKEDSQALIQYLVNNVKKEKSCATSKKK